MSRPEGEIGEGKKTLQQSMSGPEREIGEGKKTPGREAVGGGERGGKERLGRKAMSPAKPNITMSGTEITCESMGTEYIPIVWYGACSDIGSRHTMEDVYICHDNFMKILDLIGPVHFMVFDGHGGKHAADFVCSNLPRFIIQDEDTAPYMGFAPLGAEPEVMIRNLTEGLKACDGLGSLSVEPEVMIRDLTEDEFLIIGCDGIWECILEPKCAIGSVIR
ncbi:hypothetical protein GUJ93_ZPchr0012g19240 [Zizania palustris]|uniref:PPM-type phosphatase domain-containing protein n=1 Tax=Zizania palustris TaxID=103762 RepID=A0A8J5WQR5_ZIZPA|nr:hypothetical protein GUJ93_ZPchr0012g19240 [Zizania palustris]